MYTPYKIQRTRWFVSLLFMLVISICFLLPSQLGFMLYFACCLSGFAFGAFWVTSPNILIDLYGYNRVGSIYSVLGASCLIGNTFLATMLPSLLYEAAIPHDSGTICYGQHCFITTYYIMLIICLIVCLISGWFYQRVKRKFYHETDQIQIK